MQTAVTELLALGPIPSSILASPGQVERYEALIVSIDTPVSNDEATALLSVFGPDDYFGLMWTLVHLIETAPGWPILEALPSDDPRDGIQQLRVRAMK